MMQEKRIEPILAVKDHCGVFVDALGSIPIAPIMVEIERMMQEERIESIAVVEGHGGLFELAMRSAPL
jgi:hypothetical protein